MRPALVGNRPTLWDLTTAHGLADRVLNAVDGTVALQSLADDAPLPEMAGRSVLLQTGPQLPTVRALLALDGCARRVVLVPPGVTPAHLKSVINKARIDAILDDPALRCGPYRGPGRHDTEWVLFTSGTTGAPKLVVHRLPALLAPPATERPVWSTFYDVRRYGGLVILLRALAGNGSMVLSDATEAVGAFLLRGQQAGVTHVSGTPSHWRRVLISGHAPAWSPRYIRLSGEVADQAVLDRLQAAYPEARIAHAFASTEAGVAFDVNDGLAGFPAAWIGAAGPIELQVTGDMLHIRSERSGSRYLGDELPLAGVDGFVNTGDVVERVGDRYQFRGRVGGVINVGGLKVHPEEVEAVLQLHPAVVAARVYARRSPITGALVTAEVMLDRDDPGDVRAELLAACRQRLPPHKVPAMLRIVPKLDVLPSGKLARQVA